MKLACLVLPCLASCAVMQPAGERPSASGRSQVTNSELEDNRISLYVGQRALDDTDYEPVDEQGVFGLEFVSEPAGDSVGFEIGLMGSGDEGSIAGFDVEGSTGELYGGVHKSFGSGRIRPHLGGGVSFITSEVKVSGAGSDDDGSVAGYVHGGVTFVLTPAFFLGLDARVLFGSDLEIAGISTDADYGQLAAVLGIAF